MPDFTRSYGTFIAAPVHDVFEYCRDPRHLFAGWPELEVTEVVMSPDGVGTKAHIVGRFFKGMVVEQIEREYTEFDLDKRIVTRAHAKVRVAGRNKELAKPPIFTWLFKDRDGGTELTMVVLEEDLSRWQGLMESVIAAVMAKKLNGVLAAVRAGVEIPAPSTA